jgi:hypothetical protein
MKKIFIIGLLGFCLPGCGWCAATNEVAALPSEEIVGILKTNYVDHEKLDVQALETATLNGLLDSLGRGVKILKTKPAPPRDATAAQTNRNPLARAEVIDPEIGYVRIGDLQPASVRALDEELKKFAEGKVNGYILDLRFADGMNYEAATKVASRFLEGKNELFTVKRASGESPTYSSMPLVQEPAAGLGDAPLILLVNEQTSGSAEALADALRSQHRGIVIGNPTAGRAAATDIIQLTDGRWLQVATAKVVMADGTSPFPNGLEPDVTVKIANAIERNAVLQGTNITLTASLQPRLKKKVFGEAELVKAFRGEAFSTGPMSLSEEEAETMTTPSASNEVAEAPAPAPAAADVKDTVLERAVDILKGIHVYSAAQ